MQQLITCNPVGYDIHVLSLSSPVYQVEMLGDLYAGFEPSQLSCLGSLVGKSVTWRADGRGFESQLRQPIFLRKMTRVSCVVLLCLSVVLLLPCLSRHLLELLLIM